MGRLPALAASAIFAAGVAYSLWLGPALRFDDERQYSAIAANLPGMYSLDGTTPTALWPPAWPALLWAVGGPPVAGRIANFAMLAGAILIAARLAGPWAAVVLACYPALFFTAGTLYPQTLALFLLAVVLLAARERRWILGAASGALILTAPLFVVPVAVILAWRRAAVAALVCAAVVTPWCIRSGCFVSANGGLNLYLGNAPDATAGSGVSVAIPEVHGTELERDRTLRALAISEITGNPGRSARLYLAKLAHHFHFRNDLATKGQGSPAKDALMLLTWGTILLLAIWRLASVSASREERIWAVAYVAFALAQAAFFTRIRYRLPTDIIPAMLAANECLHLSRKFFPFRISNLQKT